MNYAIAVAVFCAVLVGVWSHGRGKGVDYRDLQCKAEIAAIEARAIEAERNAMAQREKGRVIADRLAGELADAKESIAILQGRVSREITRTASATRRCMSGDLAGLLNQLSPIRERVDPAPAAAAAGADAPVAAAAADRDRLAGVSERSVAVALNQARGGYETCRTTLHKLQDYVREIVN